MEQYTVGGGAGDRPEKVCLQFARSLHGGGVLAIPQLDELSVLCVAAATLPASCLGPICTG